MCSTDDRHDRTEVFVTEAPTRFEFRILGPLEVEGGSGPIALGGQKQRALLAVLLLDAGRVVATDRLVDLALGRRGAEDGDDLASELDLAAQARARRRRARDAGARVRAPRRTRADRRAAVRGSRSVTHGGRVPRNGVRSSSRRCRSGGAPHSPSSRSSEFAQAEIRRLEELRLVAHEERIEADLELGRHGDVVGRARGARSRAPAPRDAPPAAHARALSLGPAGGSARGLSGRAHALRRGARHRARPGAQAAPVGDPAPRGGNRGARRDSGRRGRRRARSSARCSRGASCRCSASTASAISPPISRERSRSRTTARSISPASRSTSRR